jgi:hypothetical protein
MVILDKARALDRLVSLAVRVVVPDELSRSAPLLYDTAASHRSATPLLLHAVESWEVDAIVTVRHAGEDSAAHAPVPAIT